MKRLYILFILAACCLLQAQAIVVPAGEKKRLTEGWEFIRQDMANVWEVMRPARKGSPESVPLWTRVSLPHCFNAEDAVDPDVNYYQGPGWYRTYLDLKQPENGERILLEFEGAGQKTDVYVYTTKVGNHVGGYDGWKVDITDAVSAFRRSEVCRKQFKGKIPVAVRCDNSRDTEMIPSDMSDFNLYGGLYRYVNLVYVPAVSWDRIKVDASVDEKGKRGKLSVSASLYVPRAAGAETVTASLSVTDPEGKEVYRADRIDLKQADGVLQALAGFDLKKPRLWSPETPSLYTCTLTLTTGGAEQKVTERFGFRNYRFEEKGPFYLNGERLLLRGTHRHEDHAGVAAAMTEEMIVHEMKQIKEMGANFIRLGHYQQSDIVLRLCDELGIMVWEEIPWCRGGLGGDVYKAQARRMLTNMIEQHYNHPSVILWGLGNENDWPGDFPVFDKQAIRHFMQELHELAHRLDSSRLTSIRRCDFCKDVVDVYAPSIWAGWYSRSFKDYRDMVRKGMEGTARFLHIEWGGDSHALRHAEGDFAGLTAAASRGDWSESYMVRLFDWHLTEQESMDSLAGSAFWTFKDFSTPLRPENPVPYVNQKGVVERDGTPKESYYVFQSHWSKQPMVHIYGHTWPVRWGGKEEKKEVLVYSNCPEVELFVNGASQGKRKRTVGQFPAAGLRWEVPFREGRNELKAVATQGKQTYTDEIVQEYQTARWGKEAYLKLSQTPLEDGLVMVEAQLVDENGVRCLDSRKFMEFSITGSGKLIQNQGTSTGSRKVGAYNGRAAIKVKAGKGESVVSVRCGQLPIAFISVLCDR